MKSINELVHLVAEHRGADPSPDQGRKVIGEIVLAMQRDLLQKTNLNHTAFRYTDVHEAKKR